MYSSLTFSVIYANNFFDLNSSFRKKILNLKTMRNWRWRNWQKLYLKELIIPRIFWVPFFPVFQIGKIFFIRRVFNYFILILCESLTLLSLAVGEIG